MSKTSKEIKILAKIIDLMREEGLEIDSPYDFENFFEDYGSHSNLLKTGRFEEVKIIWES